MNKDVYVINYGSKWGWKFQTGIVQKIYKTKEEALFYGTQMAKKYDSDLYVEEKPGKFVKQKKNK